MDYRLTQALLSTASASRDPARPLHRDADSNPRGSKVTIRPNLPWLRSDRHRFPALTSSPNTPSVIPSIELTNAINRCAGAAFSATLTRAVRLRLLRPSCNRNHIERHALLARPNRVINRGQHQRRHLHSVSDHGVNSICLVLG